MQRYASLVSGAAGGRGDRFAEVVGPSQRQAGGRGRGRCLSHKVQGRMRWSGSNQRQGKGRQGAAPPTGRSRPRCQGGCEGFAVNQSMGAHVGLVGGGAGRVGVGFVRRQERGWVDKQGCGVGGGADNGCAVLVKRLAGSSRHTIRQPLQAAHAAARLRRCSGAAAWLSSGAQLAVRRSRFHRRLQSPHADAQRRRRRAALVFNNH